MVTGVFPSDPVHLADWITQTGRRRPKARNHPHGVGCRWVPPIDKANLPNPAEDEGVRATMRGITRVAGRAQKQAAGLTAASLAAIRATACAPRIGRGGSLETAATAEARGLVDIALISLMRDGMLRRSEAESLTLGRPCGGKRWNRQADGRSVKDRSGRGGGSAVRVSLDDGSAQGNQAGWRERS